jgi:hypothetical protein
MPCSSASIKLIDLGGQPSGTGSDASQADESAQIIS